MHKIFTLSASKPWVGKVVWKALRNVIIHSMMSNVPTFLLRWRYHGGWVREAWLRMNCASQWSTLTNSSKYSLYRLLPKYWRLRMDPVSSTLTLIAILFNDIFVSLKCVSQCVLIWATAFALHLLRKMKSSIGRWAGFQEYDGICMYI